MGGVGIVGRNSHLGAIAQWVWGTKSKLKQFADIVYRLSLQT